MSEEIEILVNTLINSLKDKDIQKVALTQNIDNIPYEKAYELSRVLAFIPLLINIAEDAISSKKMICEKNQGKIKRENLEHAFLNKKKKGSNRKNRSNTSVNSTPNTNTKKKYTRFNGKYI